MRNYRTAENLLRRKWPQITPADAGDADGCRLAFTPRLTGHFENDERPREALASRGRSHFKSRLVAGRIFEVICGIWVGARAARPAICAICVEEGFPPFRR